VLGVVVHGQRVNVERDSVASVLVDAGTPDLLGEVVLGQLECIGEVVEREDDVSGGHGGELVEVHHADVWTFARRHRRGKALVEVAPLHRVRLDLDVVVLVVELVDELLHEGPVAAGEAVPERQGHVGPVVLSGELLGDSLVGAGARTAAHDERGSYGHDRRCGGSH
jgi:hypothetical protein